MSKLGKEYVKAVYCYPLILTSMGFPGGSVEKNLPAVVGDVKNMGLIPGLGKLPGEGNGNPLWYSCLKNPTDRGALWAIVHGVARVRYDLATEHACMPAEYMMRTAGPDDSQAGIKIPGRNISNLRYTDDTTLMAESKEELKRLLMKVKEESEKAGLKLNIQKTKIMVSDLITS